MLYHWATFICIFVLFVYLYVCACHGTHLEVRGQLLRCPPRGIQGSSWDFQPWWQVPLSTELSCCLSWDPLFKLEAVTIQPYCLLSVVILLLSLSVGCLIPSSGYTYFEGKTYNIFLCKKKIKTKLPKCRLHDTAEHLPCGLQICSLPWLINYSGRVNCGNL